MTAARLGSLGLACLLIATAPVRVNAQEPSAVREIGDSVSFRFTDADLRAVIQALGRYLDRPVLIGGVPGARITAETPRPVSRAEVGALLRGIVEGNGVEMVVDSAFYRFQPRSNQLDNRGLRSPGEPAGQGAPARLFVLRLKHARAAAVAATVSSLFGVSATGGGARGLGGGTLAEELARNVTPPAGQQVALAAAPGAVGAASLQGQVTIVADELTNSLLIRSTQADYETIATATQHLDLRPLQTLIEVLIVEARRDWGFSLGVDAKTKDVSLGGDATGSASLAGAGLGSFVLQVMKLGRFDLDAVLKAAVSRGDARIVSRPVVLASNNREARILVGSQRPFVQVSRSLPTETPTRDQVVQYKDVGTKLTVLPTINADGYVTLMIRQEVNSATNETQFDAPIISTREAETELLVKDGQTVVLGGLRERQRDVVKSGIPVLSSLPLIGGLFGNQSDRTTETELFLFITPTIIHSDSSAADATGKALDRVKASGVEVREDKP